MASYFLDDNFTDAVLSANYVNGRLLSAEDLQTDQATMLERITQLARAGGYGIAHGLTVTQTDDDVLQVSAGLGVNKKGEILHLKADNVAFSVRITADNQPNGSGEFASCDDLTIGSLDSGAYVLAVRRSVQEVGSAPVKSLDARSGASVCASRWLQDGLEFRAINLPNFSAGSVNSRRNRLAHACFGSKRLDDFHKNPFATIGDYGLLHQAGLSDCDLPLAVFYYSGQTISFADMWAVRRRMVQPFSPNVWHVVSSDRREAEGQARFYQFQEQIKLLQADTSVATSQVVALEHTPNLPPFGYLPIRLPRYVLDELPSLLRIQLDNLGDIVDLGNHTPQQIAAFFEQSLQAQINQDNAYDIDTFFNIANAEVRIGVVSDEQAYVLPNQLWYAPTIQLGKERPVVNDRRIAHVDLLMTQSMFDIHFERLASVLVQNIIQQFLRFRSINDFTLDNIATIEETLVGTIPNFTRGTNINNTIIADMPAVRETAFLNAIRNAQPFTGFINDFRANVSAEEAKVQKAVNDYFVALRKANTPLYCMFVARQLDTTWFPLNREQDNRG